MKASSPAVNHLSGHIEAFADLNLGYPLRRVHDKRRPPNLADDGASNTNQWNLDVANEILAPDLRFRGSLGTTLAGVDALKGYVEQVRTAFRDFQNQVDDLIAEDDKSVTRMTWTGTHGGELFGIAATGRRVTYVGAGIFRLLDAEIQEAWIAVSRSRCSSRS